MPEKFDRELSSLQSKLLTMGKLAESMFQDALGALKERDASLIKNVLAKEDQVDQLQVEIDDEAIRSMATFAPVATELRFLLMVTRINLELERIGDQAVNMCEEVQLLLSEPELKPLADLARMADIASRRLHQSLEAFTDKSTEKAMEVIRADDEVDALNHQIFRELLTYMVSDPKNVTRSVALILLTRSLERIADHATNIAEEVIYMIQGKDIRHQGQEEKTS